MGQKIVVGPMGKGLRTDVTPFNIDNDSFPTLVNAYQWRGRVKRRRGTSQMGRLQSTLTSVSVGTTDGSGSFSGNIFSGVSIKGNITGATQANPCSITSIAHNLVTGNQILISGVGGMTQLNGHLYTVTVTGANTFTIGVNSTTYGAYTSGGIWENNSQPNASLVSSSITLTVGATTFVDNSSGVLIGAPSGSGTINYSTGALTLASAPLSTVITAVFTYYPSLPVMGLEDLILDQSDATRQLGFDTTYAYNIPITSPYTPYSVSFYKNPATATYSGYTQKTTATPIKWNGQDYQQFWSTNYQGAFWETNGIEEPFDSTNVGMQFKKPTTVTVLSGTTANFVINAHGLVVGDFVFVNEVDVVTGINLQTGYVTTRTDANNVIVTFPNATLAAGPGTTGMVQYLTSSSDATKDCIRFYDGDPTLGVAPYTPTPGNGWVNFCPPLSSLSYSIADLPAGIYYLCGARMVLPFKDRLLFLGPIIQTSSAGSQKYLPDTVIYSQNGVPYYTASFPYSTVILSPSVVPVTTFTPILVPSNQTAYPVSFWEDVPGYGGFIQAGTQSSITTAGANEDVLLVGFKNRQTRVVYTGNDIIPFNFYTINSELGSDSTFSSVILDRGVISIGGRGIVLTSQVSSQRIDLQIPDSVFQFKLTSNGPQRICAQRDYINEWIYFTYRGNKSDAVYPNQTLLYNYRDASWAVFDETYTTYGTFRPQTGLTWATIGNKYPTWESWNDPWDAGESTLLQPQTIGGNSQGFIMFLADGTNEGNSEYIKSISGSTITSPGHGLNDGDYIVISGALGTISSQVNGKIFSVMTTSSGTYTPDSFVVSPPLISGTYLGLGVFKRMYVPQIQTKQFPVAWDMARKTRLGPQQYLFTTTPKGQITLLIFLSQNAASSYNGPDQNNDSLIYTSVLYTCPESTNLGLTPANINLQMLTATQQSQIWHRMNTSLLGDTVQIGFTMDDSQMRDTNFNNQFSEIELHAFVLDVSSSQVLA